MALIFLLGRIGRIRNPAPNLLKVLAQMFADRSVSLYTTLYSVYMQYQKIIYTYLRALKS